MQPLKEAPHGIVPDIIRGYLENSAQSGVRNVSPRLMSNLGEIGFDVSKSNQTKSRKVTVSNASLNAAFVKAKMNSHWGTALGAISAAGNVLAAPLIPTTGTEHPDDGECRDIPNS